LEYLKKRRRRFINKPENVQPAGSSSSDSGSSSLIGSDDGSDSDYGAGDQGADTQEAKSDAATVSKRKRGQAVLETSANDADKGQIDPAEFAGMMNTLDAIQGSTGVYKNIYVYGT
jgi:hypothetical protein